MKAMTIFSRRFQRVFVASAITIVTAASEGDNDNKQNETSCTKYCRIFTCLCAWGGGGCTPMSVIYLSKRALLALSCLPSVPVTVCIVILILKTYHITSKQNVKTKSRPDRVGIENETHSCVEISEPPRVSTLDAPTLRAFMQNSFAVVANIVMSVQDQQL